MASGVRPRLLGVDHDGGAMGIVATDVEDVVADEFLEADPDIGLDIFDEVADVDGAVGVRQRRGDEDVSFWGRAWGLRG